VGPKILLLRCFNRYLQQLYQIGRRVVVIAYATISIIDCKYSDWSLHFDAVVVSGLAMVNALWLLFLSFRFCFIQRRSLRRVLMRKEKLNLSQGYLWKAKEGVSVLDISA
jgi:hypothetical protein